MGLFSNHKKVCPICGNPTPRLLPTKIEDMPICKECDKKIYLPDGAVNQMTLDAFRKYLIFYDENLMYRNQFTETWRYDFGFGGGSLLLDTDHRLLRIRDDENALVFTAAEIKSFCIKEDSTAIYASGKSALKCHESDTPEKARAMSQLIEQFMMQRQEFDWMLQRQEMRENHQSRGSSVLPPIAGTNSNRLTTLDRPTFDAKAPVRRFKVDIKFQHPYWEKVHWEVDGPSFDRDQPSVEEYLEKYEKKEKKFHTMAKKLMKLMNPSAKEEWV